MFKRKFLLMRIRLFLLPALPVILTLALVHTAMATVRSSANFKISWDVLDEAGGSENSENFIIEDSVGHPSPIGE